MTPFSINAALPVTVLFALAACSANDPAPDDGLVYNEPAIDPNQVVCQRQRVAGSHIPRRVCRTQAQIENDREAALRATGPLRTMGGIGPPPPASSPSTPP
ncbi:MAG: hypothetical protein P8M18_08725 [Woeseiaceae bacterium]|nr:hypothetical protein [Woeseiaceae bacterium]